MTGTKPLAKKLARIAPRPRDRVLYRYSVPPDTACTSTRPDQVSAHLSQRRYIYIRRSRRTAGSVDCRRDGDYRQLSVRSRPTRGSFRPHHHADGRDFWLGRGLRARHPGRRSICSSLREQFKDGKKFGEGPIVAAEFTNRGRRIRAVRYVDPMGHTDYFSADGRSMRKAFLRTPVNFTRISSRFSFSRRHPVLHKMRAHRGVDYAAPRGTAVRASGDGRVVFAGVKADMDGLSSCSMDRPTPHSMRTSRDFPKESARGNASNKARSSDTSDAPDSPPVLTFTMSFVFEAPTETPSR